MTGTENPSPHRPTHMPEYAEACVHALVEQSELSNPLPWAEMGLDSFADLVASKMVAWVERGAPRVLRMPPCSEVLDLQGDEQNDNCEYYYSA